MAEGRTAVLAQLRAVAEAYERYCVTVYSETNGIVLDRRLPYGLGVGFRGKSAIRRAWGEYYERQLVPSCNLSQMTPGTSECQRFTTPSGEVFVVVLKTTDGYLGSGYGLTATEAEDSARRSAFRKIDFPQEMPKFNCPENPPFVFRITPQKDAWLECCLVGFIES